MQISFTSNEGKIYLDGAVQCIQRSSFMVTTTPRAAHQTLHSAGARIPGSATGDAGTQTKNTGRVVPCSYSSASHRFTRFWNQHTYYSYQWGTMAINHIWLCLILWFGHSKASGTALGTKKERSKWLPSCRKDDRGCWRRTLYTLIQSCVMSGKKWLDPFILLNSKLNTTCMASAWANWNPTHSNLACNSPTSQCPISWNESLGDASVLFPSRGLWVTTCHFSPWEINRLRNYNCTRGYTSLYFYSQLGRGQHSKPVTLRHCIEVVVSEESHFCRPWTTSK